MGFKDAITAPGILPPPLLGPVGLAKMQMVGNTLGLLGDAGGKSAQAAFAGMPAKCDPTCLAYIGKDRLMPQGAGEIVSDYRRRLSASLPEWQMFSADAWGVLRQCLNQLRPSAPLIRHITNTGIWDWYIDSASTSNPPYHVNNGNIFLWDGIGYTDATTAGILPWWRFWVVIYATTTAWTTTLGTWGGTGKKWGDLTISWGFNTPSAIFRALQSAITTWKAAGSWCRWMVVSFDATLFDPALGPDGTHNPNQTFGRWSKIVNGQYVAARYANARYSNVPE